jgi:hypothetical protein
MGRWATQRGVDQPLVAGGATPLSVGPLLVCVGAEWAKEVRQSAIMGVGQPPHSYDRWPTSPWRGSSWLAPHKI